MFRVDVVVYQTFQPDDSDTIRLQDDKPSFECSMFSISPS